MEQIQYSLTYKKVKTLINSAIHYRWNEEHPQYKHRVSIYQLPRTDLVAIFRLRPGHNRLKHHLFSRFKIGDEPTCPCGASLQDCPQLKEARTQGDEPEALWQRSPAQNHCEVHLHLRPHHLIYHEGQRRRKRLTFMLSLHNHRNHGNLFTVF